MAKSKKKKNKSEDREALLKAIREKCMEGLNDGQKEIFNALDNFCEDSQKQLFLIKGYAGTGKTFMISRFFAYLKEKDNSNNIVMTAPTHKAVGVLQNQTQADVKKLLEFDTIHKLLGVKPMITDDGREIFISSGDVSIGYYNIVVVDETSMLDDQLFYDLLKGIGHDKNSGFLFNDAFARRQKTKKVIFMGDPRQIPPVNKVDCEPFLNPNKYGIEVHELTQIMRQKDGNMIVEAAYYVRTNHKSKHINLSQFDKQGQFEVINTGLEANRAKLIEEFKNVFSSESFKSDPSNTKVIAYRNAQVNQYNKFIRTIYHEGVHKVNGELPQLIIGDVLINNRPVTEGDTIVLNNSTEMRVLNIQMAKLSCSEQYDTELKTYLVRIEYFDFNAGKNLEYELRILNELDRSLYDGILNKLSDNAKSSLPKDRRMWWKRFWKAKDFFVDYSYGYAITAHKSQGSTYKNVYVDVADILNNNRTEERNRILYTSITRASEKVKAIIKE